MGYEMSGCNTLQGAFLIIENGDHLYNNSPTLRYIYCTCIRYTWAFFGTNGQFPSIRYT